MDGLVRSMDNIVLTGLSGSGKSTLGMVVAREFGLAFLDMDAEIERRAGMRVREIFKRRGEAAFRDMESDLAREAGRARGTVVSTGGGVVLRDGNMAALRENGLVVFVDRPPGGIAADVDRSNRPLLAGGADSIFRLSRERREAYLKSCDASVANDGGLEKALEGLRALARCVCPGDGFAVIGDPIGHSMSPEIHNAVFREAGELQRYCRIHVPRGMLGGFVAKARESGLRGFNVTIPHKRDIIPFLDETDGDARLCGAVNTVVARGGRLCGYNTDMGGLLEALVEKGRGYGGRRVAIIGAGGAAAGIALKAAMEGARKVTVLGRSPEKAEGIARAAAAAGADARFAALGDRTLGEAAGEADILINATPMGMKGSGERFRSLDFLKRLPEGALVCDLVYNPPRTALLREAAALGIEAMNGLGMLARQAFLADELFLGRKLDRDALWAAIGGALNGAGRR
ncbi:MAG: shikimate dehydrogenase [Clostridiales Family XIII bacterium]|jgi:shikimate dehydrogenase|nr:shikimate dehydrogenase [Clostridiales Family XIII bacterium]